MSTMLTGSDRQYVLDRLDQDHIAVVAQRVREHLAIGVPVEACYQPGDATWYSLLFVPEHGVVGADGGGTGGAAPQRYLTGLLVVYAQRERLVDIPEHADAEWIAGKLTDSPASILAIAALLKAIGVAG